MEIYNSLETPASKEFQELLNSQLSKTKNLAEGKIIEGKITKITEKFIFLFIEGLKSEPVIDINEHDNNSKGQNFIDIIDENTSSGNINDKNVELPLRTASPDIPHNMDTDDTSFEEDFSESIESLADENISNLPDAEDWENDDGVPLFNNDRFDPSEDDQEDESQLEIPALQRFLGRIKGN